MIKLKDIILEIKKGTKRPVFPISKKEELEALNTIKVMLVPKAVESIRNFGSTETIESIKQKLRKVKIYKKQGILRAVMYEAVRGVWWVIRKDLKGRIEIIDSRGQSYRLDGTESWKQSKSPEPDEDVEDLQEVESPEHLTISKKEEAEAVGALKRIMIPSAVSIWNQNYPSHWAITDETLRKVLKKTNVSSEPVGDIITYEATFQIPSTKEFHTFQFVLYKGKTRKYGTNLCGFGIYGDLTYNLPGVGKHTGQHTWRLI